MIVEAKREVEIMVCNVEIRDMITENGLFLWQLADLLNVSESTVYRWLRHELPQERKREIISAIQRAKA